MKIAFVSQLDSRNIREWSGTPYFMVQELRNRGHLVKEVGPLTPPFLKLLKLVLKVRQALTGKYYDLSRHPLVSSSLSKQAKKLMGTEHFDIVLCPSSIVCGGLDISTPIVTWEDATFAGMVGYYPGMWQNFSRATLEHGNQLQQQSLQRAVLSIFSSDWAAQSALNHYQVEKEKVAVIPLGANLSEPPTQEEISEAITMRSREGECRLLFIGVDWSRKGGDLVVNTAAALRDKGFRATVDVVGCEPTGNVPDYVRLHGFISKSTPEGRLKFRSLLLGAHYLFVPSIAECFGLVFAEASAFGVPSLARATGGIPSAVKNGFNGWAFGVDEPFQNYADYIAKQLSNTGEYNEAAKKARQFYEDHLNWGASVSTFESLIKPLVAG
jgi:glycosyltransferase involved in cell wall biosynthesis